MKQQTAEGRLDVGRRAPEPVIKIKVAKRGVQIVAPQKTNHPPAEPQAFRITGRAVYRLLRFSKFIDFLRLLLAAGCRCLLGRFGIIGLGDSSRG